MRTRKTDQTARMHRLIWIYVGRTCQKVRFLMFGLISSFFRNIDVSKFLLMKPIKWAFIFNMKWKETIFADQYDRYALYQQCLLLFSLLNCFMLIKRLFIQFQQKTNTEFRFPETLYRGIIKRLFSCFSCQSITIQLEITRMLSAIIASCGACHPDNGEHLRRALTTGVTILAIEIVYLKL